MSPILCTALCIQALAAALMRYRLGRAWLRHPVTILVLTAITYNGISEAVLAVPSIRQWDMNRTYIAQPFITTAALYLSAGLLALVLSYLATGPEHVPATQFAFDRAGIMRALDWRVTAAVCAPLAVLTYQGRGYNSASPAGVPLSLAGIVSGFFIPLVTLSAFSFLLARGMRWFVPVLAAQSLILAAAGERLPVVMSAVTLLVLLASVGMRPSRRQITAMLALTLVIVLALTSYRAESGRTLYRQDSGFGARAEALASGLYGLLHSSNASGSGPGLIAQSAARLDGNAFAGGVVQGMHNGDPKLSAFDVPESMLVVVPSFVWPSKISQAPLNPGLMEDRAFTLAPPGGIIGPLPTYLGLYLGFLGPFWLIVFLAAVGVICGWGEKWLFRRPTAARVVFLAAALLGALSYEGGFPALLGSLRIGIILALAAKAVEKMRTPVRQGSVRYPRAFLDAVITQVTCGKTPPYQPARPTLFSPPLPPCRCWAICVEATRSTRPRKPD